MPIIGIGGQGITIESANNGCRFQYIPDIGFGNSALFPDVVANDQLLSMSASTQLVTWKATTGFTIEYWIYPLQFSSGVNPGPGNQNRTSANYWTFGLESSGRMQFYYWGPGENYIRTQTNVLTLNTWHNVCFVATTSGSNSTVSVYVNGVRQDIQLNASGLFEQTKVLSNGAVDVNTGFGMGQWGGTKLFAYFDNLRVSNVNRYTGSSYTVATSPFVSDANTQLLMYCDGPNGSTTFTDSSSFNRTITNLNNRITISNARANHS